MQRLISILRQIILAALLVIPFITYEYNEQSPFELPKMLALSYFTLLVAAGYIWTKCKEIDFELKWNNVLSAIVILLLVVILSYQKSNYKFFSFWGNINVPTDGLWSVIICTILSILCVQLFDDRKKILSLLASVFVSHILLAAYGIIQHFGLDPINWWGYANMRLAAYATLGQPVAYSTIVGVSIPIAAAVFYCQKKALRIWLSAGILFALILGQLYSGSRTPVLMAIIGTLMVGVIGFKSIPNSKKKFLSLLAIIFIANFVYFAEGKTAIGEKLKHGAVSAGLSTRVQVWVDSIEIWKKYPYLGSGPETFANELKLVNQKDFNTNLHWGMFWHKAHNHFFHFLATIGIVGALAHIFFFALISYYFFCFFRPSYIDHENEEIFGLNAKVIGFSVLLIPIFIYITNLTAFNFVLTQAYTLIFAALIPTWKNPQDDFKIKIKFPKYINFLNIVFLTIIIALFANNIFHFWTADRYFSLSRKYFEADRDFEKSMRSIDKAITYKPEDCRHLIRKAIFLSNVYVSQVKADVKINSDEAVHNLKTLTDSAVECNRNASDVWYFRGQIFSDLYFSKIITSELIAEESLIESRKLNPANPVLTYLLGVLYNRALRFQDFEKEMFHAIDLKSDFFAAHGMLIDFYYSKGRQTEVDRLVNQIKNVSQSTPEMTIELMKILAIAKQNNDFGNAKILQDTYIRLTSSYN